MSKIVITGGNGFLGRNLALQLKSEHEVILASRNNKNNALAKSITGCDFYPLDICNIESVRDCFRELKPDIVIAGAATKFVDLSEKIPLETIDVNVLGAQNTARAAMDYGVKFVLGISTDKACPPIRNIYGLSKATMERMFCLLDGKTETKFAAVRYGNVCWSTGSVFPIWQKMFLESGIIGTTGPEMRRFFFSIDEAVALVKTAINNQDTIRGKILSREMKCAQIKDILRVWTNHYGGSWKNIEGRPGERLDEFLVGETELEYSEQIFLDNTNHYLISPNTKSQKPLTQIVSSANSIKLTDSEILTLINSQPDV